jgi:hypothetical protein
MATNEHTSATALTQQCYLSPANIDELHAIHDRLTFVCDGLQGVGVAASLTNELGLSTLERLGHAVFALGQYAGDLNERLEVVLMHSEQVKPQQVA